MSEFRPGLLRMRPKRRSRKSKAPTPVVIVKKKRRKRKPQPQVGAILKPKLMVKLRYVDTITIAVASAAINNHVFRANSIFDPDLTSTGHQPLLHDLYSTLYERYRVVSSTIKVTPVTTSLTSGIPAFWGVFGDEDSALNYSLSTAVIEDSSRTGGQVRIHMAGIPLMQGNSPMYNPVTSRFDVKKNLAPDGQNDSTAFGSNPVDAETTYKWQVWCGSILVNDPGVMPFLVEIEYTCELTDPIVVVQS